jgi:osmotically inducible lipoprotein OsmB
MVHHRRDLMRTTRHLLFAGLLLAVPVLAGCDSNVGKGAAIGAAGGAGVGALGPGSVLGNAAAGAAAGAAGGFIYDQVKDKDND